VIWQAIDLAGDLAFAAAAVAAMVFVVLYATRSRWHATPVGRATLGFMAVVAAILVTAILFSTVWDSSGFDHARTLVRAVLYAALFGGIVWYTVILVRAQRADRSRHWGSDRS